MLDELARRHKTDFRAREDVSVAKVNGSWQAWLAKPGTFVNLSGYAVCKLRSYYKIPVSDVLVVTDDVNLPLGRLRARARGSEGGHNGLRSVIEQRDAIWRTMCSPDSTPTSRWRWIARLFARQTPQRCLRPTGL